MLKPGRPILLAEITLSPQLKMKAEADIHIDAWIEKIFSRIGWSFEQTPYYSLDQLRAAFDGVVYEPEELASLQEPRLRRLLRKASTRLR